MSLHLSCSPREPLVIVVYVYKVSRRATVESITARRISSPLPDCAVFKQWIATALQRTIQTIGGKWWFVQPTCLSTCLDLFLVKVFVYKMWIHEEQLWVAWRSTIVGLGDKRLVDGGGNVPWCAKNRMENRSFWCFGSRVWCNYENITKSHGFSHVERLVVNLLGFVEIL